MIDLHEKTFMTGIVALTEIEVSEVALEDPRLMASGAEVLLHLEVGHHHLVEWEVLQG